jgi:uncharacterized glyoxalase superfamily protein PhnB
MAWYGGLGFEEDVVVPWPDGAPVMAILARGSVNLIADALVGMPFPDSERERRIQRGPRGLGVVVGLPVEQLDATYAYCMSAGCEITCEPMDEAWCERVFSCVDPSGSSGSSPCRSRAPNPPTAAAVRDQGFGE